MTAQPLSLTGAIPQLHDIVQLDTWWDPFAVYKTVAKALSKPLCAFGSGFFPLLSSCCLHSTRRLGDN